MVGIPDALPSIVVNQIHSNVSILVCLMFGVYALKAGGENVFCGLLGI